MLSATQSFGLFCVFFSLVLQYIAASPGVQGAYMPQYPPMQAAPVGSSSIHLIQYHQCSPIPTGIHLPDTCKSSNYNRKLQQPEPVQSSSVHKALSCFWRFCLLKPSIISVCTQWGWLLSDPKWKILFLLCRKLAHRSTWILPTTRLLTVNSASNTQVHFSFWRQALWHEWQHAVNFSSFYCHRVVRTVVVSNCFANETSSKRLLLIARSWKKKSAENKGEQITSVW